MGDGGSTTFAAATSNSVLVSPALSYQAKVVNPDISGLGEIVNTAYIQGRHGHSADGKQRGHHHVARRAPSATFIFYDNPTNPNGLPDGGEAGIPDVTVTLYRVVNGVPAGLRHPDHQRQRPLPVHQSALRRVHRRGGGADGQRAV